MATGYDWASYVPQDRAVICFVRTKSDILLIRKKRGLGEGKINGPGGRLEGDETPRQAAVRETQEEIGITMLDPAPAAELSFAFSDGYTLFATVFISYRYHGALIETDEAAPFWQPIDQIPYDEMWYDDRLWLPHVLEGTYVVGRFLFDGDTMLEHELKLRDDTPASNPEP
jgi:8-oxo-dGTP diphosphatase